MIFSWDKFIRPLSGNDTNIQILDNLGVARYTINPFSVLNVAVYNNSVRVSLKSSRVISIPFSSLNEAKMALPRIKQAIDGLQSKTPIFINNEIKNYVSSVSVDFFYQSDVPEGTGTDKITVGSSWYDIDGSMYVYTKEDDYYYWITPAGVIGPEGPIGATGNPGIQGPTGATGNDGPIGPTGNDGPIGPTGNDGPIGPTGNDGPIGPTGATGNDGPIGPTGATGNDGPIGPTGATGNDGPIGPTGATGNDGPIGPTGATGNDGPIGPTGNDGPIGPTGATGDSGPTGATGDPGIQGATGSGFGLQTFTHDAISPLDVTTYYFGQMSSIVPGTTPRPKLQIPSLYTGTVNDVSLITSFTGGSSQSSTLTLANVTQVTSSVISNTLQYYAGPSATLITESLQTPVIPSGWSQVNVSFSTYAGFAVTGLAPFAANLDTLTFDASLYSALSVSFDTAKFGTGANGPLRLSYSLDGGSSWTVVGNGATPTSNTYLSSTLNVPVTSSTMRLRWDMTQTVNSAKRLQNVVVNGTSNIDGSSSVINLASPMSVTIGDLLEIQWQTPTWSLNPSSVVNIVNLKIDL